MQSQARDVEEYLRAVPDDRRAVLDAIRDLCRSTLDGYEEGIAYGMPSYSKDGTVRAAFASQKNYISLYVMDQAVVDAHRDRLAGLNVGKGCIRFRKPEQVDLALVADLLAATRDAA